MGLAPARWMRPYISRKPGNVGDRPEEQVGQSAFTPVGFNLLDDRSCLIVGANPTDDPATPG